MDVLIVGAGLSGIGAAYYLQREHPQRTYAILEARDASGGTWDLFRFPGIRSDSDLHTFGYEFKPWRDEQAIAGADKILAYLRETAAEHGIDGKIRFGTKVLSASWSSSQARWSVLVERPGTAERTTLTCKWLFCAGGYYRYDEGFTPHFEGRERFRGQIIHPQHWPAELSYEGQRVLVIGSGATAVTMVPAMADSAAHVTMLQRTPSYVMPVPARDKLAGRLRTLLGEQRAYAVTRRKNIFQQQAVWRFCQKYPKAARRLIRYLNAKMLPEGYPVDEHFNPPYNPWTQRLCAVPDGDLFRAIRAGRASVVTDRIVSFTEDGVRLQSGRELAADLIVTATGLNVQAMGGMSLTVDGEPVSLPDTVAYKGMMLSGVPNFAYAVGYTNSSWTLKIGLLCEHFCRLLAHMDENGYDTVRPVVADPDMLTRPMIDFGAGYVQRALAQLPRQGSRAPWLTSVNYAADVKLLRHQPVTDSELQFSASGHDQAAESPGTPTWRPDILGDGYQQHVFALGPDPDGEGSIAAVLVRREPQPEETPRGVVLYVHGFADYFFQTELADFFAQSHLALYALDLRKSGRARRPGQTAHYVSDLRLYDDELERALTLVTDAHPGLPVILLAHSTGGLIVPLWLDRRRAAGRVAPVAGLMLNSPWFDLQGKPITRSALTQALRLLGKAQPFRALKLPAAVYGETLHTSRAGEWDFDLDLKPLAGFPVTLGWLNAVRRGQARLHRGLDVGVPSLILRSDRSHFSSEYSPLSDRADTVLDVTQIARWAGCLGAETTVVPIKDARHDVILSLPAPREHAYATMAAWLTQHLPLASDPPAPSAATAPSTAEP
jgi:monooxygenase